MAYMVTYSENMCTDFMQSLCPSARLVLKCRLLGCRLVLRCVYAGAEFSIEPGTKEDSVPAVVWEIDSTDEKDLPIYYPEDLFKKVKCRLITERMQLEVFLFAVRGRETALPDEECIEKIAEAYGEHGFDFWFVEQAIDNAADSLKGGGENGALHTGTA